MKTILPSLLLLCVLTGCEVRSISDSGYSSAYRGMYKGELNEMDILGAASPGDKSGSGGKVKIPRGSSIILIQSGALVPDAAMMEAISGKFTVAPFSGIPTEQRGESFSKSLRSHAMRGGHRYIVCYWGVLESARHDKESKAISWIPIVGTFIPDEKQQMRIRLKALVLDAASGRWKMHTPQVYADQRFSSEWSRSSSDQNLVESLKQKAYQALVADLLK